jgi:hypothetical protein
MEQTAPLGHLVLLVLPVPLGSLASLVKPVQQVYVPAQAVINFKAFYRKWLQKVLIS